MAITTAATEDLISSSLWNQVAGMVNGTSGKGQPVALTDLGSADWVTANPGSSAASLWSLTVRNRGTGGQALRVQDSAGSTIFSVADAGVTIAALSAPTVTGQALFASGSVSAPSISFTGDTNTGVYRSGADTVNVAAGGTMAWKAGFTNAVFARTTFGTADFPASLSGDAFEFQTAQPSLVAVIDRESGSDKVAGPAMTIYTDKYAAMNDGVGSALGIWAKRAWNDTALNQAMQAVDIHAQQASGYRGNIAGQYIRALGTESYTTSTQATATATVSGGVITGTSITNGGAGYATAPTITVTSGTGTLRAVMTNGVLTGITVTSAGTGAVDGTMALTISAPSGGSVFGSVVFAGETSGGTSPQYLETVGMEINPYRVSANASTDYSLSTVPGSQVGRSIGLNLIATGTKKHTAALVVDSHDHTNGNYYTGIDFIQGGIDSTTNRAIRLPNGGKIYSRLVGGGETAAFYVNTSDHTIVNSYTGKETRIYVNDATLIAQFASGAVTVTGTFESTGAATANRLNLNTTGAAAGEVKTSSHAKLGGAVYPGGQTSKYLTMVAAQSVAASATVSLGSVLGLYAFFDEDTDGAPSLVWLRGSGATVTSISTPDATAWNIDSDAGSRWAVYHDGSVYRVKNRAATSKQFSYTILTSN